MLFDKKQLLYEPFLALKHALMLVLKVLCEHIVIFIVQITYKLAAFINFHSFW